MRYLNCFFLIFLLFSPSSWANKEIARLPFGDHISLLITEKEYGKAHQLIDKSVAERSLDATIATILKAKIAFNVQDWPDWRRYSEQLIDTPVYHNMTLLNEVYESLPENERQWLIAKLQKGVLQSDAVSGACPLYEIAERAERAQFLWKVETNHQLPKTLVIKIFRELYVERPEAVEAKNFVTHPLFADWQKTLTIKDFLQRINNLLLFGKNNDAKETIEQALLTLPTISDDDKIELRYQGAKLERKFRNYKKARQEFQEIAKIGNTDQKMRARYMDLMLASMADDMSVRAQFDSFVADYPTHGFSDDVLLFKAKMERSTANIDDMFTTLDTLIKKYPLGDMIQEALFIKAFELAKLGKIAESLKAFSSLEKLSVHDSLSHHQALYWQARLSIFADLHSLTNPKKSAIAPAKKALNLLILSPSPTVYSWLALDLFKELKQAIPVIKKKKTNIVKKNNLIKDDELRFITQLKDAGLISEALALLNEKKAPNNAEAIITTAKLYIDLNHPERAYQKLIQCNALAPRVLARDPELYERILLPRPFSVELNAATKRADVPHELIYAVMRRESFFSPHALSWAQARGLMQMMKATADQQAKKIGLALKSEQDLFDPGINLLLGTTLLHDLWQSYGNWAVVLCAYNAGPGAARSWLKKNEKRPLDNYLENISYKETKEYVAIVLGGVFHYSRDKGLKNLASLNLKFAEK